MVFHPYSSPWLLQTKCASLVTIAIILLNLIFVNQIFADTGSAIKNVFTHSVFDFSGGLNSKDSVGNIANNETPDCQNVYFWKRSLLKRKGYDDYLSAAPSLATDELVTGLVQFTNSGGTTYDIACAGDSIKYNSGTAWTAATGSLTGTTNPFDITIGDDYTIFSNNVDRIQYWNGTGNTNDLIPFSGFDKARCIEYHQGYLFIGNVEVSSIDYPSRIYYSTQGDITTVSAADYFDVNENDGQPITGLAVSFGDLIIFKSDSMWKLSGYGGTGLSPNSWALSKISSDIGCVSTYSIVNIGNELLWLGRKGVYGYTGRSVESMSDKIQPEFDGLSKTRLPYAVGGHLRELNQYWLSVSDSGSSTNDITFVYNYKLGSWTKYIGINASYIATWLVSSAPTLITGNYSGYVYKQHTGNTDDGTAIDAYYDTRWHNFQDPIHKKYFRRINAVVKAEGDYNLDMYAYLDFKGEAVVSSAPTVTVFPISLDSGGAKWGSAIWGQFTWGTGGQLIREQNLNITGYWIKYRFRNTGANEPFELEGYSHEAEIVR